MSEYCNWQQQVDFESDTWESDCGVLFCLNDSGPIDNDMRYCCGCGKPLSETGLRWDDKKGYVPSETRYPVENQT